MEKLKCLVPESIKRMVGESSDEDLASTSSTLLHCLLNLPQFQQMIDDLADSNNSLCGKNKKVALELKQKGNGSYLTAEYASALESYSQALRVAPMDAVDMDKNLVATLFLNRASLFHKIGFLTESLRDCKRAIQISPTYAKAWYRRGKANVDLGNFKDAVNDFNNAKSFELSLDGKRHIETELNIILERQKSTSRMAVQENENCFGHFDEPHQLKLSQVSTPDKGRGMASQCDIPQASLVHKEEPYALIILKSCRETHCHYCLNQLRADTVPCTSCTIPLYCSEHCQIQAGGEPFSNFQDKIGTKETHSHSHGENKFALCSDSNPIECFPEHKHECLGVNWPVILPSDIVLAGRILVKSTSQRCSTKSNALCELGLSHSYTQITPESKLELHIYAIVLLCCLQHSFSVELPINGVSLSQTIILISQIRVNSMAIVRMKSVDDPPDHFRKLTSVGDALTSSLEQVPVGQAIYKAASLFNHSCLPNIHAYFLSRTLFIRTTEYVSTGCPLELSYGPQGHKLNIVDINDVASLALKFNNSSLHIHPGFCLHCGSHRDLDASHKAINKAWSYIKRLQEAIISKDITGTTLLDASRALGILRSTLHAYNKSVAEAEDNLAQAFCLVRDFQSAREHCKESIKILQTLYDPDHIVIGYELVKLASIQLSLDDPAAVDSTNHLGLIFARYFGPHVDFIVPYQQFLKRVAHR
ncbi:uncharacterized protein [Populus alba]|uniref:uncharacterized protein isoform X2 n=1 Tax=Populus alba TaxID=43335 RepID=UPI00158C48FD|nr:SET and MYND domain-containing protein 4 isoform X2 [Populus alba]